MTGDLPSGGLASLPIHGLKQAVSLMPRGDLQEPHLCLRSRPGSLCKGTQELGKHSLPASTGWPAAGA